MAPTIRLENAFVSIKMGKSTKIIDRNLKDETKWAEKRDQEKTSDQ